MINTKVFRVRNGNISSPLHGERVATLGSFDGIHIGHRSVLDRVRSVAQMRGVKSALVTFIPHPSVALKKTSSLPVLTTLRQKSQILSDIGIDELILIRFNRSVFELSYEEFLSRYVVKLLKVSHLIIGPDARVGRGGEGTSEKIVHSLLTLGKSAEIVQFQDDTTGNKIGSRAIRELIAGGNVEGAVALLGRRYQFSARVVKGDGRGGTLGFPTANLYLRTEVIPRDGVYVGFVRIAHQQYQAVANIGMRPTFGGVERRVEVHILNGNQNLYDTRISFEFVARLRDEKKFDSVDQLKQQIADDIARAQGILKDLNITS